MVSRQAPAPDVRGSKEVKVDRDEADMFVRTPSAPPGEREGTSLQMQAALVKKNGKVHDNERHLAWTSRDPMIATVDSTGLVVAQDVGAVYVLAEYKDKDADSVLLVIRPVPVAAVVVAGADSLSLDDTDAYTATALDADGRELFGRAVTWSSSDRAVANVNGSGEVFALTVGTTDITATIDEVTGTRRLRVWPQPVAKVVVTPATTSLAQFRRTSFTAVAYDKRDKVLTDRAIGWSSSAPAVLSLSANADTALAKDVGTATVTATAEGVSGVANVTVTNPVEARALWVNRIEYTNFNSVDFARIGTIFRKAASANFNVVYFQVRTAGDALYFSDIEPCSPRMCGTLGGPRPARDPLAVALDSARHYGLQLHAWVNAYTGFIAGSAVACNQFITSTPANWLRANPQWSASARNNATGAIMRQVDNCTSNVLANEYMYVSPGVPQVRTHVARVAADIARRYGPLGLKGIHLDRIRFPNQIAGHTRFSYDPATQEAFRQATGALPTSDFTASWQNFRRGLVNQGVKEIWDSLQVVDRSMALSAAVWPAYTAATYNWATNAAVYSHTELFQDPVAWAQGGYLDVEVPMIYPASSLSSSWTIKPGDCAPAAFTCAMDDHLKRIEKGTGRHVYVGIGAIKGWAEMTAQLDLAHDRAVTGISVYSYSQVDAIPNGWALLAAGPFKNKATIPAMAWK